MTEDHFAGRANGRALDFHFLGRNFTGGLAGTASSADAVAGTVSGNASAVGLLLAPQTAVSAALGGGAATGCTQQPLEAFIGAVETRLGRGIADANIDLACGQVDTTGNTVDDHSVTAAGKVAGITVGASEILGPVIEAIRPTVNSVINNPIVDLVDNTQQGLVGSANSALGQIFGSGNVVLPVLDGQTTLGALLDSLKDAVLLRVVLGDAVTRNVSTPQQYLSEAVAHGGTIELLPNFVGLGRPLVRIVVGEAAASVTFARGTATPTPRVDNTLVRIESPLLPALQLENISTTQSLVQPFGYNSEVGVLELAPGQSAELFCGTPPAGSLLQSLPVGLLCTRITVGQGVVGPDFARASSVEIHLLAEAPAEIGRILGQGAVADAADSVVAAGNAQLRAVDDRLRSAGLAGLDLQLGVGTRSTVNGIKLTLAVAEAQANGKKDVEVGVLGEEISRGLGQGSLPRTGMEQAPLAIAVVLGASAGLRALLRRRSTV